MVETVYVPMANRLPVVRDVLFRPAGRRRNLAGHGSGVAIKGGTGHECAGGEPLHDGSGSRTGRLAPRRTRHPDHIPPTGLRPSESPIYTPSVRVTG